MARIISKPGSDFFNVSYGKSIRASTFRTSVANQPLNGLPFKQSLKFRVSCSIKETERENAAETQRIVSGLEVNGKLKEKDGLGEFGSGGGEVGFNWDWPPWKNLPQRYKLIGTTSLAFVVCNMDKVNLSVAIIPMSHQFGWNASVAGLVQSSFFWGYALSQLPGGWLAKVLVENQKSSQILIIQTLENDVLIDQKYTRKVLEVGVLVWSLATALVPLLAGFMPGLIFSRILVGIGEGVSPSAATDMIARSIPIEERSRAVSFVFGGLSVGSVLGLLSAPPLIQNYGWGSVFYIFGSLGLAWFSVFQFVREDEPPFRAPYLSWPQSNPMSKSWGSSLKELSSSLGEELNLDLAEAAWLIVVALHSIIKVHIGEPSKMNPAASINPGNMEKTAWSGHSKVSVLPPLASVVVTSIASQLADSLISKGVETTVVRKICQTIAFVSPATCMILSSVDLGLSPWEVVSILTGGLALSSFALSGLYCTHQDMSPEYASVLLGITNTVGAIPGIIGVALTGYLLDTTHSWAMSLFAPSIVFYLTGTIVWLALASSKPQTFSKTDQ
ncbi:putative anion transporter 6, chloroplastic [Sesamum angolense]|uniref:Anion transporter 6, chloroplastic n=1 Tax=Sesamum angolense TaxID=2727404 RepID=A0AAE1WE23_9LAMI|nr:putative anion transporter 6, chloroplastic [Sesamum angolense]